jgi:hypothetical protein
MIYTNTINSNICNTSYAIAVCECVPQFVGPFKMGVKTEERRRLKRNPLT